MRKKLQVFISSTYTDLRDERQVVVAAVLKNGHIPAGMELFAAGNEEQMKVIKRWIDESDVFCLLLGKRYGSIEPTTKKSYTQLEYEYAMQTNKPLFAIILSDAAANAKVKGTKVEEVYEQAHQDAFHEFEKLVRSKMCSFADDLKDIRLNVGDSLRDLELRHEFTGWISGRDLPDESKTLADVASTAKRNTELQSKVDSLNEELNRLKAQISVRQNFEGRTFEELADVLKRHKVTLVYKSSGDEIATNLFDALLAHADDLSIGVEDSHNDFYRMLFWNVAGPLATYGLAIEGKVLSKVHYRRFILSDVGKRFVTEMRIRDAKARKKTKSPPREQRLKPP